MLKSILVGTDGSDAAGVAISHAIGLASALGARLHIVSAYAPVSERHLRIERVQVPSDVQVNLREEVLALLEASQRDAEAAGVSRVEAVARVGEPAGGLLARRRGAGLRPHRRRQQGDDRGHAVSAGVRAAEGVAPRALLGDDRPRGVAPTRREVRDSRLPALAWPWGRWSLS